ncbi:MAG: DUF1573 domain-containing protein [Chitinophagaceae bacterium]|nr:DUF1573 domain-containing protein [Chitinophagaceae bacterium]
MTFRNATIVLFMAILWTGCTNTPEANKVESTKLDASLINNPRSATATDEVLAQLATMDFEDTAHDFGRMYDGETASYDFKFTNNGKAPLLISNAAGTCGCTVPNYPHEPIAPGASAVIAVKFNSASKVGLQNKSVNIFTNSAKGTHTLHINAEVVEK